MSRSVAAHSPKSAAPVDVVPADTWQRRRAFHLVPWEIYKTDPVWVPPLLLERRLHFSSHNPYFAHAHVQTWLAYKGRHPVGRISAQIDRLYHERYRDPVGFFGFFEAIPDEAVIDALLATAEQWLWERDLRRVLGPFSWSINDECGLLVEGFDTPPSIMMGHAPPYYAQGLEKRGYQKAKDLFAYHLPVGFTAPTLMQTVLDRAPRNIRTRPLDKSRLTADLEILRNIFEDAWSDNWGFIPFTKDEFAHLGQQLNFFVQEEFVQIAEIDGEPAAMIVAFPNVNEAIRDLNGRLLPWGWLKLLWRMKVSFPKSARIPLMGVSKRYQRSPLGLILAFAVIDAVRQAGLRLGVEAVELSWILEDNDGMNRILQALGGAPSKRYRIYQKDLS